MRYLFTIIIFLALALPAHASTFIRGINTINVAGSALTSTIIMPAVVANDTIVLCVGDSAGNAVTQSAGGWTAYGSPSANTQWGACWTRTATGSETTFTYTFITGGFVSGEVFTVGNTDGSVPVLESAVAIANANTAGSLAANAITPSQGGDFIAFVALSSWPAGWPSPVATSFFHNDNGVCESLGFVSEAGTSASITPTFTPGHANAIQIITIGFKSSSTTPALFIGVGTEAITTGTTTSPTVPSNAGSGNTFITAVKEQSTSGVLITPPSAPDIGLIPGASGSPNSSSFTVPSNGAPTGNIAIGCAYAGSPPTAPSGWTPICTDSTHFGEECAYKVLVSGDIGTSPTWGGSGVNIIWGIFASNTGATLSIDGASSCSAGASSSSFIPTTIITGTANETVVSFANQGGSSNITVPGTQIALRQNAGAGSYLQVLAGATSSQTFGSAGSNTWEGSTTGIKSNTAAGSTNPWHVIGSPITDPTGTTELDLFWANYLIALPTTFTLGSSISTASIIIAFANLNSTTPIDVSTVLGIYSMGNPMFPSITPSTSDELLLRFSTLGYVNQPVSAGGKYTNLIFNGTSNGLTIAYEPLQNATAEVITNQGLTSPFASVSTGLNATTTPTRTTANADINQAALEVFTTSLPAPVASTGIAEIISDNEWSLVKGLK